MNVHLVTPYPDKNTSDTLRNHHTPVGDRAGKLADGMRILRIAFQEADHHRIDRGALHIARLADRLNCPNLARIAREMRSAHALGEDHATAALAARLFRLGQAITMGTRVAQHPG